MNLNLLILHLLYQYPFFPGFLFFKKQHRLNEVLLDVRVFVHVQERSILQFLEQNRKAHAKYRNVPTNVEKLDLDHENIQDHENILQNVGFPHVLILPQVLTPRKAIILCVINLTKSVHFHEISVPRSILLLVVNIRINILNREVTIQHFHQVFRS